MIVKTTVERSGEEPEVTVVQTCDMCGSVVNGFDGWGQLTRRLRAWDGMAYADDKRTLELCGDCMLNIFEYIDDATKKK